MNPSILSFKPGHDGSVAFIENKNLLFSLEAEKDSFPRYSEVNPSTIINAFSFISKIPDVVAVSGWVKGSRSVDPALEAGYFGTKNKYLKERETSFLGKKIKLFTSTHERSHIFCSYGMSPFKQGQPCYMLVWEGALGHFYEIDENLNIKRFRRVLKEPGNKYSFLYSLADPTYADRFRLSSAGKLMALAAFSDRSSIKEEERETVDYILEHVILRQTKKSEMFWSPFYNIGVEHSDFKNIAGKFSDAIFNIFYNFAKKNLKKGYPLLIGGGCGLNCEWNTKWKESGLFAQVFVPPVTNDSGAAIGTAIDAQFYYTNNAKISWDVYKGSEFIKDSALVYEYKQHALNYDQVARFLSEGKIIAWVQGRCEIGPRALGNRSLLASPFKEEIRFKLNEIKNRESYRPVAPICIEEDVCELFDWKGASPYMLYFQKVKVNDLKAITHVDKSARVQTINQNQNPRLYNLLMSFKKITNRGVLCNTSLNFNGKGFINRFSDLVKYSKNQGLDGFVIEDLFYEKIN